MSGDHDKYHGTAEVMKDGGVYLTAEEMQELIGAFEEALYLLDSTEEDIEKKAGVYRVMTARWKLKEKNRSSAPEVTPEVTPEVEQKWVGLTKEELQELWFKSYATDNAGETYFDRGYFANAIEAKLKELNG